MPEKLSSEPGSPLRKRRRVRKACVPCRKRKRKCDGRVPCGMCVAYEYHCEYHGGDVSLASSPGVYEDGENEHLRIETHDQQATRTGTTPSKFFVRHSAVTFPRTLGLELQSANPPRPHSFGWHCGIRPEEYSAKHILLSELVTKDEFHCFSEIYFKVVQPIFNFIDWVKLTQEAEKCWHGADISLESMAIIAGVIGLGSFFSGDHGHPREMEIIQYAKNCIDDPAFSRFPSMDQISSWLLRTLYLRSAAPAHVAWLASCTSLQLAAVIGLHHEIDMTEVAASTTTSSEETAGIREQARNLFWSAWTINTILSYDYGRLRVNLGRITCRPVTAAKDFHLHELVTLAKLIPQENDGSESSCQVTDLLKALESVYSAPDAHPFVTLTKADLCLSFYRRLRLLNHILDRKEVLQIVKVGNTALSAACYLVKEHQTWWNALSSPFQYICVLLAIDTSDSLSNVGSAFHKLDEIAQTLDTTAGYEAQSTAKLLLQDSMKRKKQEISLLKGATQAHNRGQDLDLLDVDWNTILDPSKTISFL